MFISYLRRIFWELNELHINTLVQTQATKGPQTWLMVDDWTLCVYRASHRDQNTTELMHVCSKPSSSIFFLLMEHVHLDVLTITSHLYLKPNSLLFPSFYYCQPGCCHWLSFFFLHSLYCFGSAGHRHYSQEKIQPVFTGHLARSGLTPGDGIACEWDFCIQGAFTSRKTNKPVLSILFN